MEDEIKNLKIFSPRRSFLKKFGPDISGLPNYADVYETAKENHNQKFQLEENLKQLLMFWLILFPKDIDFCSWIDWRKIIITLVSTSWELASSQSVGLS